MQFLLGEGIHDLSVLDQLEHTGHPDGEEGQVVPGHFDGRQTHLFHHLDCLLLLLLDLLYRPLLVLRLLALLLFLLFLSLSSHFLLLPRLWSLHCVEYLQSIIGPLLPLVLLVRHHLVAVLIQLAGPSLEMRGRIVMTLDLRGSDDRHSPGTTIASDLPHETLTLDHLLHPLSQIES